MDAKTSEQTNGPHNRKKNIRTPFSRPSFPLSLSRGFRDGARERFSRAFHTMSHPVKKKKKRDGRAFRGRRSGVYVIAGWWTLVYLRKRARQAPFLLLALSSSHYPSSLSLIKAAPLFIKFHERNRVTCNRGGKKKWKRGYEANSHFAIEPWKTWTIKRYSRLLYISFVMRLRSEK